MAVPQQRAMCTIRFSPEIHEKKFQEFDPDDKLKLRLRWAASIHNLFYTDQEPQDRNYLRNFDIILNIDGSAENYFQNQAASPVSAMLYPARYQLPEALSDRLDTVEEKIARAELFALGSILYEVVSGHKLFHEFEESVGDDRAIQRCIAAGHFPEDLWYLPVTPKILLCFYPGFLEEMCTLRKTGIKHYAQKHPIRFTLQALGGVVAISSIVAIPILGAVGFSAAGPVAGSAAAAWQSSIGLVEAGSIFAWCQSAAMGGAAVGGIIGAGVGGAGVVAGATKLGVLDGDDFDRDVLRRIFLAAWGRLWGRGDNRDQ